MSLQKLLFRLALKFQKKILGLNLQKLGPVSRTIVDVTEISAKSSTREMLSNVTLLLF